MKKAIQERRIKEFFIEAAKDVIRREGLSNLTVKKIAGLAGYAPGTLYNYFTDLNALLFYCIKDFWQECIILVRNNNDNNLGIKDRIVYLTKTYAEYFIDNPNIYQLMFLEDLGQIPATFLEGPDIPEVAYVLKEALGEAAKTGIIPSEKVEIIENLLDNATHGILLSYIKGRSTMNRNDTLSLIEEIVDYLVVSS